MQTSGQNIMFNDVVNMLKGEDLQLLQEAHTGVDTGSVLVAINSHSTCHGKLVEPTSVIPSVLNPPGTQLGFSPQLGPTQPVGFSQFGYMPGFLNLLLCLFLISLDHLSHLVNLFHLLCLFNMGHNSFIRIIHNNLEVLTEEEAEVQECHVIYVVVLIIAQIIVTIGLQLHLIGGDHLGLG